MKLGILYSLVALIAVVAASAFEIDMQVAGIPLNAILGGVVVVAVGLGTKLYLTRLRNNDRSDAATGVEGEIARRASSRALRDAVVVMAIALLVSLVTPLREWPPAAILTIVLTIVSVDFWVNYAVAKRGL